MAVKVKFFQIVCPDALQSIADVRKGRQARQDAIIALLKEFGVDEIKIYGEMIIDAVVFPTGHEVDTTIWRKARGGWLPRVKTGEAAKIAALPECEAFESVIERWGMGNECIMGLDGGRTAMWRSVLVGTFDNNFFYVKVPYNGEYGETTPEGLKEIKEWEALKGMGE